MISIYRFDLVWILILAVAGGALFGAFIAHAVACT